MAEVGLRESFSGNPSLYPQREGLAGLERAVKGLIKASRRRRSALQAVKDATLHASGRASGFNPPMNGEN
jgi:hypothetical protein